MIIVSVTYPASAGSRFDLDYYRDKHIPLVRARWGEHGLTDMQFVHGTAAPGGGPIAFHMVALLTFESAQAFEAAGQAHGREIMSDIPNFTDVKPVVQLNEPVR